MQLDAPAPAPDAAAPAPAGGADIQSFLHTTLGRSGERMHRLGLGSSYGIGGRDLEAAVEEHGLGYLYWGSRRSHAFARAIRALTQRGRRDQLYVVVQSFARVSRLVKPSVWLALKHLGLERIDMLLLGLWNKPVRPRILAAARACQEQGLIRHIGVSTHRRLLVPELAGAASPYDVVHFRYNAANRGAEREIFPHLPDRSRRAGTVSFTSTRWGQLLKRPRGAPPELRVPSAGDCYRFVLQEPQVDVVVAGPRNGAQLREALAALERGPLDPEQLAGMRAFGDQVYRAGGLRGRIDEAAPDPGEAARQARR